MIVNDMALTSYYYIPFSSQEVGHSHYQPLSVLNSAHPNFFHSLSALDRLPSRFCDTIFVLHCKEGLTKAEDILTSQVCMLKGC